MILQIAIAKQISGCRQQQPRPARSDPGNELVIKRPSTLFNRADKWLVGRDRIG